MILVVPQPQNPLEFFCLACGIASMHLMDAGHEEEAAYLLLMVLLQGQLNKPYYDLINS